MHHNKNNCRPLFTTNYDFTKGYTHTQQRDRTWTL